ADAAEELFLGDLVDRAAPAQEARHLRVIHPLGQGRGVLALQGPQVDVGADQERVLHGSLLKTKSGGQIPSRKRPRADGRARRYLRHQRKRVQPSSPCHSAATHARGCSTARRCSSTCSRAPLTWLSRNSTRTCLTSLCSSDARSTTRRGQRVESEVGL